MRGYKYKRPPIGNCISGVQWSRDPEGQDRYLNIFEVQYLKNRAK